MAQEMGEGAEMGEGRVEGGPHREQESSWGQSLHLGVHRVGSQPTITKEQTHH